MTLRAAAAGEAELLGNLLQLYIHDLSAVFANVQLGEDGRFAYPDWRTYLAGSGDRVAFIVRSNEQVAGFVLVKHGSPFSDDPRVLDIAEFFVLRRFRGSGVGRLAAEELWAQLPGNWMVRAALTNPDAVAFWRRVITKYTRGAATETERVGESGRWAVFSFESGTRL